MLRMEAKSQEAEANMAAAKKLLNVTCDACVQLTHDFQITKPERAFLDILGGGEEVGRWEAENFSVNEW